MHWCARRILSSQAQIVNFGLGVVFSVYTEDLLLLPLRKNKQVFVIVLGIFSVRCQLFEIVDYIVWVTWSESLPSYVHLII